MKKLWKITGLGIVFLIFLLFWTFFIGFSSNQPGSFFNKGHNAVWLGHEWVGENKSDQEIQELVNNLQDHDIDTVFVHSGPLGEDGSIDPKVYEYAVDFIDTAKRFNKDIEYQAWLGQIRRNIDLSNPDVRHNVANQSMILAELIGFDGIHFDVEPVWDGDLDFIETLKESREILSEDKKISVALAEFIPGSLIWLTSSVHTFTNYNTEVNYENVAQYADQIVVMVYDTSMRDERLYEWFVREQLIWVTDLFDDKEVFIGIPSYDIDPDEDNYEERLASFDINTENIGNALDGVINGLNNFRSNEDSFAGVAIYSYWEMEEEEWGIYKDLWME